MIKFYQKKFNKVHVLMDAFIIVISYLLAYYLRFFVLNNVFAFFEMSDNEKWYSVNVYTDKLILVVPLYLLLYYFLNVYTPVQNQFKFVKSLQIVFANILGLILLLSALYLLKEVAVSRQFLILFFVMNVILSVALRILYSFHLKGNHKNQQLIS